MSIGFATGSFEPEDLSVRTRYSKVLQFLLGILGLAAVQDSGQGGIARYRYVSLKIGVSGVEPVVEDAGLIAIGLDGVDLSADQRKIEESVSCRYGCTV